MYNISASHLKQNTRSVLDIVDKEDRETIVMNYKKPKAVIISYKKWLDLRNKGNRSNRLQRIQKYVVHTKARVNSAKIIRAWRDAE